MRAELWNWKMSEWVREEPQNEGFGLEERPISPTLVTLLNTSTSSQWMHFKRLNGPLRCFTTNTSDSNSPLSRNGRIQWTKMGPSPTCSVTPQRPDVRALHFW